MFQRDTLGLKEWGALGVATYAKGIMYKCSRNIVCQRDNAEMKLGENMMFAGKVS